MIYSLLGFYLNWRAYNVFAEGHPQRWEVTLNQQSKSNVCLLKHFHRSIKVFEVHLKWKLKVQLVKDPHEMVALIEVSL